MPILGSGRQVIGAILHFIKKAPALKYFQNRMMFLGFDLTL